MAFDTNVTSSIMEVSVKRRVDRIDFQRPPTAGAGSLTANVYLRETTLNATETSPRSGSVVMDTLWMIEVTRAQILDVAGAGTFLNGMVALASGLKDEFDSTGILLTGSMNQLS